MFSIVPQKVGPADGSKSSDKSTDSEGSIVMTGMSLIVVSSKAAWYKRLGVFIVNVFLTPILLVYWSTYIFFYPCVVNVIAVVCCKVLFSVECIRDRFKYVDQEFGCTNENANSTNVTWVRLADMFDTSIDTAKSNSDKTKSGETTAKQHNPKLFDHINPSDLAQGQLGDCWLIAALATLADHPELLLSCFVTKSFNVRGKYVLRLFDSDENKFKTLVIDDFIPCQLNSKKPLYTHIPPTTKRQLWPLLIEKAFAKMKGGYGKLKGGTPLSALVAITGCVGEHIIFGNKGSAHRADDILFKKLKRCSYHHCLLACGSKGKDDGNGDITEDNTNDKGIVKGHAYSILGIFEPHINATDTVKLLKLRNPWGKFEWKGDWSDTSVKWIEHPTVANDVGKPPIKDDGIFFIPWDDFANFFDLVDIIYLGIDIRQMHINVHEELGDCTGTCSGCVIGLCNYWCFCQGCCALWWEQSSKSLKDKMNEIL